MTGQVGRRNEPQCRAHRAADDDAEGHDRYQQLFLRLGVDEVGGCSREPECQEPSQNRHRSHHGSHFAAPLRPEGTSQDRCCYHRGGVKADAGH